MKPFDYMLPKDLAEACSVAAENATTSRLLSGGTDLTVGLRHCAIETDLVIDLKQVAELRSDISEVDGVMRVSAGTTMTALEAYLDGRGVFPALRDAASVVGSIQIRNRATLAGNICNASPAADTVPVLAAYGAEVEIHGLQGMRTRLVADFIEGNRQIDLSPGEIVTAVRIPLPQGQHGCAFDRITRRRGVDLATTNMCMNIDDAGQVTVTFGAVSPRPLVLRDETNVLGNVKAAASERTAAIMHLAAQATPISDVRAQADYRSAMLCVMAERSLATAHARRAGGGSSDA
ncbi:MAG: xanthine dehydrogenase family protein subunit M [Pseudomonadota bacterium]